MTTQLKRQLKRLSWDWFWQEGWLLLGSGSLVLNLLPSALCLLAGVVYHWGAWRGWLRDPLALWIGGLLGGMGVVTSLGVFPWASWAGSFNYWPFWLVFGGLSWGRREQGRRRVLLVGGCGLGVFFLGGVGGGGGGRGWGGGGGGRRGGVWRGWGGGGGVLAILGILDGIRLWLILGLGREYRPLAVFTSHNILGVWLVLLLLVSYGWRRDPRVWIFWILAGLMVLLTGSRNSWGILMVGLLVLWLVQRYWLGLAGLGLAVGTAVGAAREWPGCRWLVPPLVW
ncbi:MAG: hypothetical protein Q6J78_02330, partial [Thermostichales cyanobacterium SRBZ-1_bins_19]